MKRSTLSASELKICAELNCDPKVYARVKAAANAPPTGQPDGAPAPGGSPSPSGADASKKLVDVAKALGVDPSDLDALRAAFSRLVAAVDSSDTAPNSSQEQIG